MNAEMLTTTVLVVLSCGLCSALGFVLEARRPHS
jgi:hypothetical protein